MSEPDVAQPGAGFAAVGRVDVERCGHGGQAFAVAAAVDARFVVTVAHVFDDAAAITLRDSSGSPVAASVVHLDEQRDIALIELDVPTDDWLRLGAVGADQEATVLVRNPDDSTSTIPAAVNRLVDVSIDGVGLRSGLEVDAALDPGRSGAPLVDADGAMVGMAFATDRESPRAWAVAANEIEAALAQPKDGPISFSC